MRPYKLNEDWLDLDHVQVIESMQKDGSGWVRVQVQLAFQYGMTSFSLGYMKMSNVSVNEIPNTIQKRYDDFVKAWKNAPARQQERSQR